MIDLNNTEGWEPIATAPRDGSVIWVMDPDCGAFLMRWSASTTNPMFSDATGMWLATDGSLTWCEDTDAGPTWWRAQILQ
ncbi:hypothetical protein [Methylobacterium sp. WL19]|uniref:hypothetical protein n=1 Tax=Methylobacterium sp. WL19 TaxID=2603896 RepID=UPI0011C9AB29|nr:hypothetical protein [Methylobacterium sp. WL19]TXN33920.1 hypothetical protein FV220_00280 [Methylobacterium sp. WL19]